MEDDDNISLDTLDVNFSLDDIESEAKRRVALKDSVKLSDDSLKAARKALKKVAPSFVSTNSLDILKDYKTKRPLPESFNWATQLEGVVTQVRQAAGTVCVGSAVFSSIADHFLIARRVSEPIVFSDMHFYSHYPPISDDKLLKDPYSHLRLECNLSRLALRYPDQSSSIHGLFTFSTLLFIQLYGLVTDRCLPVLPQILPRKANDKEIRQILKLADSIQPFTCYYKHPERYTFFIKDCVMLATESSSPRNVWAVQEVIKRHIFRYGPVVARFRTTKKLR